MLLVLNRILHCTGRFAKASLRTVMTRLYCIINSILPHQSGCIVLNSKIQKPLSVPLYFVISTLIVKKITVVYVINRIAALVQLGLPGAAWLAPLGQNPTE